MTTKVDDLETVRQELVAAEAAYREAETALVGVGKDVMSTPQRVLAEREHRQQLETAASTLIEAKERYDRIAAVQAEQARSNAATELADLLPKMQELAGRAETEMDTLAATLAELIALAHRRYAAVRTMEGRASRGLLLRNPLSGWVKFRLADLDLPDMHPPSYFRQSLTEMLGNLNPTRGDHD